jgi:sugar phosphate isomerase/epimerase
VNAFEKLQPSVLSSSSGRHLPSLFHEVGLISGVRNFDLLVPRPCDLPSRDFEGKRRFACYMANDTAFAEISDKLMAWLEGQSVSIPSLATFFPKISSSDESLRQEAVTAIVNTFRLAKRLKKWMPVPVVEVVCGTIVEASPDGRVSIYGVSRKLDCLVKSLEDIVSTLSGELTEFAVALELEPGEIYLFNDDTRIRQVFELCDRSSQAGLLKDHVGLNVDIAHMRIAGVSASQLEEFLPRMCHAHVSDHPGIHTHDQFVGNWTNIEQRDGGYLPYLRQLLRRCDTKSSVPFTRCVAIELEGCNRIFSIHDSISRLRHAITLASDTLMSEAV